MTHVDTLVPAGTAERPRLPGFLLTPFGWAAEPLTILVDAEPRLLADLFEISRPRMHLIELVLDRMRQAHGAEWGRWELTSHEIEIPMPIPHPS
jgi:hypothetical protein